jgi:metallo-beta-lactamase class B
MRVKFLLAAALTLTALTVQAQPRVVQPIANQDWVKPFPGFKIVGNVYYVGTYDLAAYLIATNAGHILINTGVDGSYDMMKESIEKLGFKVADIKIITSTHGHRDHVGDIARFQKESGAKVYMSERDVASMASGGNIDYRRPEGRGVMSYDPIKTDVVTRDGDKIRLGPMELTVLAHPGHTPGATSFMFPVQDGGRTYNVGIINMNGINEGVKLLGSPGYPTIVEDFRTTLEKQAKLAPDIFLSSHAGQFNLHQVYKPGDPYNPARFGDLAVYRGKVQTAMANYQKQLAEERQAQRR